MNKKDIIKYLRRARLYKGRYNYPHHVDSPNQILYWNGLVLFDFKENTIQQSSGDNSGTELCRTIVLKVNMGKLTKKYGDCMVTIPKSHIELCRGKPPGLKDYDEQETIKFETKFWIITNVTKTYDVATPKSINLPAQIPLKDVFRHYIESTTSIDSLKLQQIEQPDRYSYEMKIPGVDYVLKFFVTGSIYSISAKVTQKHPASIPDILKMNHWASIELKDMVEKASICRKVERECEPDYESETEIIYDCKI